MRYAFFRLLPALIATVLLAGCRGPAPTIQRLIEEEPTEIFHTDLVAQRKVLFRLSIDSPADLEDWEVERATTVSALADGGVVLRGPRVEISRDVEIVARHVDALEVDALSLRHGELHLSWSRAGAPFRRARQLTIPLRGLRGDFGTRTFYLRKLPAWRGKVGRIRFLLPRPGMGIREVRGVRMRFEAADLATALGRAWKVELDSEVRTARLAAPGSPIEWPVTIARGSQLKFSYGIGERTPGPIRFRISARRQADSEAVQLFEDLVDPAAEDAPQGWRERSVDLDSLDGSDWTLVLETEDVDGSFDPVHGFPVWGHPEILPPRSDGGPPNVLLISVDTLRSDHLTFYGYSRPTSPNLEEWAERSTAIFDNAIAPTPSTLFSHASLLSGRWSMRTGVERAGKVPRSTTLLAEHLHRAGYTTRAVTGGGWLHPLYGFSRGFDVYRYWSRSNTKQLELEDGIERADRWLRSGPASPFFLFFHTYEVHSPFQPRQPYLESFGGPAAGDPAGWVTYHTSGRKWPHSFGEEGERQAITEEELSAYYDAGIAYTDGLMARILSTLRETGLDRDTVVVLTSDHGESLGEKGRFSHGHLDEANLKVPLVIAAPGSAGPTRRIPQQVSLPDITPTLLELAGVEVPEGLDGLSLVPLIEGRTDSHRPEAWSLSPVSGTALLISNRLKYIYRHSPWGPELEAEELYRLDEDPQETRNVAASASETPRLRERVRGFLRGAHQGLRMSFDNSSDTTFRGTLQSGLFFPGTAVFAPEMPCACLRRKGLGEATVEVPPGMRFELFFVTANANDLRLTGELEGGAAVAETIDLTILAETWRWTAGEAGMEIAVWWQGGLTAEPQTSEPDPELVDRLRDLGYLE